MKEKIISIIFFSLLINLLTLANTTFTLTTNGIADGKNLRNENVLEIGDFATINFNTTLLSEYYNITLKNQMKELFKIQDLSLESNFTGNIATSDSTSCAISISTTPKYSLYLDENSKVDMSIELTYKNYLKKGYIDYFNFFPKISAEIGDTTYSFKLGVRYFFKTFSSNEQFIEDLLKELAAASVAEKDKFTLDRRLKFDLNRFDGEMEIGIDKAISDKIYAGIGNYNFWVTDNRVNYNYYDSLMTKLLNSKLTVDISDTYNDSIEMLYQYIWVNLLANEKLSLSGIFGNTNYYFLSDPGNIYGEAYISTNFNYKFDQTIDEIGVNGKYSMSYQKERQSTDSTYFKIYLKKSF